MMTHQSLLNQASALAAKDTRAAGRLLLGIFLTTEITLLPVWCILQVYQQQPNSPATPDRWSWAGNGSLVLHRSSSSSSGSSSGNVE